ncbi:MAG: hypothetical protein R2715_00960 [Ilumatobacteraceae bacterium]
MPYVPVGPSGFTHLDAVVVPQPHIALDELDETAIRRWCAERLALVATLQRVVVEHPAAHGDRQDRSTHRPIRFHPDGRTDRRLPRDRADPRS